jgi:hypothetical protein
MGELIQMTDLPSPPRIPVSGATNRDIEATAAHIELLTALFKSVVLENANLYRSAILAALVNHNENVSTSRVRTKTFEVYLDTSVDEFLAAISDVTGDVVAAVQRALEE